MKAAKSPGDDRATTFQAELDTVDATPLRTLARRRATFASSVQRRLQRAAGAIDPEQTVARWPPAVRHLWRVLQLNGTILIAGNGLARYIQHDPKILKQTRQALRTMGGLKQLAIFERALAVPAAQRASLRPLDREWVRANRKWPASATFEVDFMIRHLKTLERVLEG